MISDYLEKLKQNKKNKPNINNNHSKLNLKNLFF